MPNSDPVAAAPSQSGLAPQASGASRQGPVPKVGVLVLNYRGWRDTLACIDSVRKLAYANVQLLVVDNASPDNSLAHLRGVLAENELHVNADNLGFGGGNNRGIERLLAEGCQYVWLLNNDALAEPEALAALVQLAEREPDVGAVGSQIFDLDRPTQLQAWGGGTLNFWLGHARHVSHSGGQLTYLTGASMLLRAKALAEAGGFDERYFFLWEDVDLSLRLVHCGWRLAVAETSRVRHKGGGTEPPISPFRLEHHARGLVLTMRRHGRMAWLTSVPIWGWYAWLAAKHGRPSVLASAWRGWWAGWRVALDASPVHCLTKGESANV